MPPSWITIGYITFFAVFLLNGYAILYADDATDFYFAFAIHLANGFPLTPIYYAIGYAVLGLVLFGLAKVANPAMRSFENPDDLAADVREQSIFLAFPFFIILVVGSISGARYLVADKYGCNLANAQCPFLESLQFNAVAGFGEEMANMFGFIAALPYFLVSVFFWPALIALLVAGIPIWITAVVTLTTRHPAEPIIKRSGRTISQELATVLEAQLIDDEKAARLFHQMGPLRQLMWKAHYSKRRKESQRFRETMQAQRQAWEADDDLMNSAISRDRTRARYDR